MHHKVGSLIKLKRVERKITQEELCEGICTPSYLSRIENNRVIADEEIYRLLFRKMDIDLDEILNFNKQIDDKIEKLYMEILLKRNSDEHIKDIDALKQSSNNLSRDISLKLDIGNCRYLLSTNQIDSAENLLNNLETIMFQTSNRNFFLYTNVLILYQYIKKNYSKAIEVGQILMHLDSFKSLGTEYELGIFFYNLQTDGFSLILYQLQSQY